MEKILKGKSSIMYVYRNKSTGDFVDEDGNPTDSVYDSVGYSDREVAIEHLKDFDEPEDWYIVMKVITETIIGEPVQITEFI